MARPRVFVSSTYYDLKHIRSALEIFIDSLGYDPILSEKGDIAYHPDSGLDESCYREAAAADIFVLIVGGRYGSETSNPSRKTAHGFFESYDSITRKEYETAVRNNIPIYILIEAAVHAEYQTYLRNKGNESVTYAHVDSINIFKLLEIILSQPRNNPIFDFDQASQIEAWLREQWSGLFRDLLRSRSQQKQLSALTEQISELKAVNSTLKTYLEAVVKKVDPSESENIIRTEDIKMAERQQMILLKDNVLFDFISSESGISAEDLRKAFKESETIEDFLNIIHTNYNIDESIGFNFIATDEDAIEDANNIRRILGLPEFPNEYLSNKDDNSPKSTKKRAK